MLAVAQNAAPDPELLNSDAALYLCDDTDGDAIGYHQENHIGTPYGFVFTRLAKVRKCPWSAGLSHEVHVSDN